MQKKRSRRQEINAAIAKTNAAAYRFLALTLCVGMQLSRPQRLLHMELIFLDQLRVEMLIITLLFVGA